MKLQCAVVVFLGIGVTAAAAAAQSVAVSIGVRETGTMAPLGADGGTNNGIEWVDLDLNIVALDGGWQQVVFDLPNASLTAFAGATANSVYSTDRGTLDAIRIRNIDGLTDPLRFFIDDLIITDPTGAMFHDGWESPELGAIHIFHQPSFSGSTNQNLEPGSSAGVSLSMPHTGSQSYEANFQFIDDDSTRWLRFITFDNPSGGNPTVDFGGTVSFWIKGAVVPTPPGAALAAVFALGAMSRRRRN